MLFDAIFDSMRLFLINKSDFNVNKFMSQIGTKSTLEQIGSNLLLTHVSRFSTAVIRCRRFLSLSIACCIRIITLLTLLKLFMP